MAGAQVRQEETSSFDEQEDAADVVIVHEDEDEWDGDDGYAPRTKEEILEGFRDAVRELKLCLEGKHEMEPIENFFAELEREDNE